MENEKNQELIKYRIRKAKEENLEDLDLSRLGLTELPYELFQLTHYRRSKR